MSINLIDSVKELFTNALISKASSALGESENGISKTISAIIPSVASGLISKASSTDGANTVAQLAHQSYSSGILENIENLFNGDDDSSWLSKGTNLISSLFGDKIGGLANLISGFSGTKSSTTSSLLSMAVPTILGFLGKHAATNNLSASGLSSFLSSQKQHVEAAMPTGFNLGNLLSGSSVSSSVDSAVKSVQNATTTYSSDDNDGGFGKFLPYLLLLAAIAAIIFWWKGCKHEEVANVVNNNDTAKKTEVVAPVAPQGKLSGDDWMYDEGDTVTIKLPNNAGDLRVGKYSTEAKLVEFLQNPNAIIDNEKGNWFEFTNVHFKTGSSDLTDASKTQLKNMVAISKAYPTAKFKFGGYTDSTGKHEANLALSQKRAEAVAATVKKLGAAADAITGAEGYAEAWPLASNTTPEGRAQNRRVSVRVKSK